MKDTPTAHMHHTAQVLCFAYSVLKLLDEFNAEHAANDGIQLHFRMGVHCGACVGSVIGTKQVSFDLWGDSVRNFSFHECQKK
jgi:class 3 adenylate cyclase